MFHGVPLLQDFLTDSAARLPEKEALVTEGSRYSYRTLDMLSDALAQALVQRGVLRGDRVLIFCENGLAAVVAFWSTLKAGAVAVPLHPETKAEKFAYVVHDSRAAAIVVDAHLLPAVAEAVGQSPHLGTIVVAGAFDRERYRTLRSIVSWDDAIGEEIETKRVPRRCIDIDLAAILYTSGSTGEPKGVMLTHRNMITAATSITALLANVQDDVILDTLPMSSDYGLYQTIMAFRSGARLVLEKDYANPAHVLARIVEEQVTGLPAVPTMLTMLSRHPSIGDYDLGTVRYLTSSGSGLTLKQILRLAELFPTTRIFSMYGLTECKRCTYLPSEDLARKPHSVGIPIPNTEVWVVDEEGRRVGPDVVGQLVVRGATVTSGYWGKPAATAERLRPGPLPGELVLYTGDLCSIDAEGYVYFVARMDDIIKCRGEKVAPKMIEHVLLEVPGVKEAAVIGVHDDVLGQVPKAYVVLEADSDVDERVLKRECWRRLEAFMVPSSIEITTALPHFD